MWSVSLSATLVLSSAQAATPPVPSGHKSVTVKHGCQISVAPTKSSGVAPIRADCHWPDVTAAALDKLLADWDGADRIFSSVAVSEVKSTSGGKVTFYQVHTASGISDREAMLVGSRSSVDGGFKYAWTMDGATQAPAADGRVTIGQDDGSWTVTDHPEGGVAVTYRLEYDPAGSVPSFFVRSFQSGGIVALVGELKAAASK